MPRARELVLPPQHEGWTLLLSESQEGGGGLASSPYAMPGFFVGWITVGVLMAVVLVVRGHDARTMLGLGVGLGPLMALVASDTIRRREPSATALELEPVGGAQLALWPGSVEVVAERFRRRHRRALVLLAVAEPSAGTSVSG